MSITRISDRVFLDLEINDKKKRYKASLNVPVEGSFLETLHHNDEREAQDDGKKHGKEHDAQAIKKAWEQAQESSRLYVEKDVGTHIDASG